MLVEIGELEAQSATIQAEIDAYRHRVQLFDAASLDPDILTERARALLNMAQADDVIVMLDPQTGMPRLEARSGCAAGRPGRFTEIRFITGIN